MSPQTLKDMPSHDKAMIDYVLTTSKFRHSNSLVGSRFVLLLTEHVREHKIVGVRELCRLLFEFSTQCAVEYDNPDDFIERVGFSRAGISNVLISGTDRKFSEVLGILRRLAESIEKDLMEPPAISVK